MIDCIGWLSARDVFGPDLEIEYFGLDDLVNLHHVFFSSLHVTAVMLV